MAKRPYKKLSPEAQAEKNRRQREKQRKLREAGFSRDQARSLEKTLRDAPPLIQAPTEAVIEVISAFDKFAEWLTTDKEKAPVIKPPKPKKPKKKKVKPTTVKYNEEIETFEDLVRINPGMAGYKLIDYWNENLNNEGKNLSKKKGYDQIREIRHPKKPADIDYGEPIVYYSRDDRRLFGGAKKLMKDRYMYLMAYEVMQENDTTRQDFMYISSDVEMNRLELRDRVIDEWADAVEKAVNERYKGVMIVEESIFLVHAVDTEL